MKTSKTHRGFAFTSFTDRNGVECNIQKSSIATEDCIWFGAKDIGLKGFDYGWRSFSEEDIKAKFGVKNIIANNRMHLTREQVKELIPILQKFVDSGEI